MFRFLKGGAGKKRDSGRPSPPPKDPMAPKDPSPPSASPSQKDPVVDVQGMIRQASNRVEVQELLKKGKKDITLLSREKIQELINRSVQMALERQRAEGGATHATVSQLQAESRAQFDELLQKATETAKTSVDPAPAILELIKGFAVDPPALKGAQVELSSAMERPVHDLGRMEVVEGRGLNVGTVTISAGARTRGSGAMIYNLHRNAFLDVRRDPMTYKMLGRFGIKFLARGERVYIAGDAAFNLANLFEKNIRRPMRDGMISPEEPEALLIVNYLVSELLGPPQRGGEICVYSVPADCVDAERNLIYHRAALEGVIRNLGYAPKPMMESHLIVFAEMKDQGYTGIGISCGGGMFNVCLAYKGVPVLTFSTSRGGDWIDKCAADAIGVPPPLVSAVKEGGMHLLAPKGRVEQAIAIHYRHLLQYTLEMIRQQVGENQNASVFTDPVDIVCAGGSSLIPDFIEVFCEEFKKSGLPLKVGTIRGAADPMTAVVTGCVQAAIEESRAQSEGIQVGPAALERAAATTVARIEAKPPSLLPSSPPPSLPSSLSSETTPPNQPE